MTQLMDVNKFNILDAIHLGCKTMQRVFNADDNNFPYFGASAWPVSEMSFSSKHGESHVPGRHLNALLNAEQVAGLVIDETAIDNHMRAAFFSYSGIVPLPLNRSEIGGPLNGFQAHNVREGFHALYALSKYRRSNHAQEIAESSIETILKLWDPYDGFDVKLFTDEYGLKFHQDETFISGLARAIGPLVKYYQTTTYGKALELATLLKEKVVTEFFKEDGHYEIGVFGSHAHSVTSVMSSLAQLADLTFDRKLMRTVKAFYDNGLWDIRDETGWSGESSGPKNMNCPDKGEVNNSGDILETALLLGRWGHTDYYGDAERIIRCHILPSQLRDTTFIEKTVEGKYADSKYNVGNRLKGAWGFPAPYGHEPIGAPSIKFNLDVVGGVVGSLCEAYRNIVREEKSGLWVTLLFDYESSAIRIESPYTHPTLKITPKQQGPLFVRLPTWTNHKQLTISGIDKSPLVTNGFLFFEHPVVNHPITFAFPLVLQNIALHHKDKDILVRLRGDEVAAMQNLGANLTFFDPL